MKKQESTKKSIFDPIYRFYNLLLDIGSAFKAGDTKKRISIVTDLCILVVITCFLKIPFIFIRDLGDNLIGVFLKNNMNVLAIWGLIIELVYVFLALTFFIRTLKKWVNNLQTEKEVVPK